MLFFKASKFTMGLIYVGTLLLSILSFFTTYLGMKILLNMPLALAGALGLQIAMLGVAWNLMKIREKRWAYVAVFMVAATFSIFFSYANFDAALKGTTRAAGVRREYAAVVRPVLAKFMGMAREAIVNGQYQVDRIGSLRKLEEEKGWATVVDEGTRDRFIQSVIDGARVMVDSWKRQEGYDYRQGSGRGIIADYLENRHRQMQAYLEAMNKYNTFLDSASMAYSGDLSVDSQYALINGAWIAFPAGVVAALTDKATDIPLPPEKGDYVETPVTSQQAFMLVIHDLMVFDRLAVFSLLLAIAVDCIVIIIALVGSYAAEEDDAVFERVRKYAARKMKKVPLDNPQRMATVLRENIDRFEIAGQYSLNLMRVMQEYEDNRKKYSVVMHREGEDIHTGDNDATPKLLPDHTGAASDEPPEKIVAEKKRRTIVI